MSKYRLDITQPNGRIGHMLRKEEGVVLELYVRNSTTAIACADLNKH